MGETLCPGDRDVETVTREKEIQSARYVITARARHRIEDDRGLLPLELVNRPDTNPLIGDVLSEATHVRVVWRDDDEVFRLQCPDAGRLYVEQGGDTGIIDEYKQHRSNFVIVSGSHNQVAVGVEGDVHQTSVQAGVPQEAFDLLDQIEQGIAADQMLEAQEREHALTDVRAARDQLQRKEPNKRAALGLLDPLAKIATVGGFVAKLVTLLS